METAQLQLILNVVGITVVSTFVAMCFLRRRENRRLAEVRDREYPVTIVPVPAAPMLEQDIRDLAQSRRTEWVQGLSSAITFAKGFQK